MKTEYHAFVDGDVGRCGVILRHMEPRSLRTRTVFRMGEDAPVYLVDHVVDHDGDVRQWSRFSYDSPSSASEHSGTRDPDGTVHVNGTLAPELADAVGAYCEHLLLAQMIGDGTDAVSYLQLDESEPEGDPQTAELHRRGIEATELLDGSTVDAERIQLVLAGRSTNAHWCVDGVVVKSDWCGPSRSWSTTLTLSAQGSTQRWRRGSESSPRARSGEPARGHTRGGRSASRPLRPADAPGRPRPPRGCRTWSSSSAATGCATGRARRRRSRRPHRCRGATSRRPG